MIELKILKARVEKSQVEPLTSGMSGAVFVRFAFDAAWDGLSKTAVFTSGGVTVDVPEARWVEGGCTIPQEVLAVAGKYVSVGVYGTDGGKVILPTIWCDLGRVLPGADPSGNESTDPSLPVWAQLPPGGKEGQLLYKQSDTDYDAAWQDLIIPEQYGLVSYDQDKTISVT